MGKGEEGREAEMEERGIRTGRGRKGRGGEGGEESLQVLIPGTSIFFTNYKRKFRVLSSLLVELRSHLW